MGVCGLELLQTHTDEQKIMHLVPLSPASLIVLSVRMVLILWSTAGNLYFVNGQHTCRVCKAKLIDLLVSEGWSRWNIRSSLGISLWVSESKSPGLKKQQHRREFPLSWVQFHQTHNGRNVAVVKCFQLGELWRGWEPCVYWKKGVVLWHSQIISVFKLGCLS